MENMKSDQKKWGNIGLIVSFFGILIGLIGIVVYSSKYSISIILVSLAALFASVGMRSKRDYPILQFAAGLSIGSAVFLTAISKQNQYSALLGLGFVVLILLIIDIYRKHRKSPDN
jgi:hypothetical protein